MGTPKTIAWVMCLALFLALPTKAYGWEDEDSGTLGFVVLELGLTIWSSVLPDREGGTEVSLSPLLIPDSRGEPALGIGLNVVSW